MKHSAYAQWIFQLGFPMNDPIVELAAAWASGTKPGSRTLRLAYLSAERWLESRDKKLRSAARAIMNKLAPLVQAAERDEKRRQFVYPERSLTGQPRSNPRRRSRRNCGSATKDPRTAVTARLTSASSRKGDPRYATTRIIRKGGKSNPWVKFKAKGKRVKFWAKKRRSRKGRTPRHLIPYLFRKGHRPANARRRSARRSGRGRRR